MTIDRAQAEEYYASTNLPAEYYALPDQEDNSWRAGLLWKNKNKKILESDSLHNAILLLQHSPKWKGVFVLDEFCDQVIIRRCPVWEDEDKFNVRRVTNDDIIRLTACLEIEGLSSSTVRTKNALFTAAKENRIHPVREYFDLLKWDGVDRLSRLAAYYLGAEDQPAEYLAKIPTTWLVAGVTRIYEPGAKFDHMLVLEGPQDTGKSTALKILSTFGQDNRSYFSDRLTLSKINDSNTMMMLQGNLIIEFSELAGINRKETEEVKQWITLTEDEGVKKWEVIPTKYPRQFILAGTTNESSWLKDTTGNRRFWPIKCGQVDLEALRQDKEQIWAQAVHLYKNGFNLYISKDDPVYRMAQNQQSIRLRDDIWTDAVLDHVQNANMVRITQILKYLGVDLAKQNRNDENRVTDILKKHGWESYSGYNKETKKSERSWIRKKAQKELL